MKVTQNDAPLLEHSQRGFEAAIVETLNDARSGAPRRTGEYSGSLSISTVTPGERLSAVIGSSLARGGAVEHGADVGPRRGPHMAGAHSTAAAVQKFPDHMTERLRSTPV